MQGSDSSMGPGFVESGVYPLRGALFKTDFKNPTIQNSTDMMIYKE